MLEDDFTYVLRKALAGQHLAPADAAAHAGVSEHAVLSFLRGTFSAETARRLSPVLGLNPDAFAAHPSYQPRALSLPAVDRLDLPFGDGQVNAWLVKSGNETILFDAGFETKDLIGAIEQASGRLPDRVFITHSHRDHIGGLDHLLAASVPVHSAGIRGTILMKPSDAVFCDQFIVRACDLSGHDVPAFGFSIEGLHVPTLVTGDALFAGSIGGCPTPTRYQQALRNLRIALAHLSDDTVFLPGHGPATTLGEERAGNPFL